MGYLPVLLVFAALCVAVYYWVFPVLSTFFEGALYFFAYLFYAMAASILCYCAIKLAPYIIDLRKIVYESKKARLKEREDDLRFEEKEDLFANYITKKGNSSQSLEKRKRSIKFCNCERDVDGLIRIVLRAHGVNRTCDEICEIQKAYGIYPKSYSRQYDFFLDFIRRNTLNAIVINQSGIDKIKEITVSLFNDKTIVLYVNSYFLENPSGNFEGKGLIKDALAWVFGVHVKECGNVYFAVFSPEVDRGRSFYISADHLNKISTDSFSVIGN